MAKLDVKGAGFNAGKNHLSRSFPIKDIVVDPQISKTFKIQDAVLEEVSEKIRKAGYDRSQPVVVWKGHNILVDGHTRLAAVKEAGLEEIPVVEMEFADMEEALLYTFERQVVRRNLTSSEILAAATMLKGRKDRDGQGRAAEQLAKRLGVSPATIYQARKIQVEAPEEDLRAIQDGKKTIKSVYNKVKKTAKKEPEGEKEMKIFLGEKEYTADSGNTGFLKSAVILLVDAKENRAAELIMNHFLRKNEKNYFYKLLPANIRDKLPKL